LKKVKKNWPHELKCATTTSFTKTKGAKVRAELKTTGTTDVNAFAMLSRLCCWSDKLRVSFELRHDKQIRSYFLWVTEV